MTAFRYFKSHIERKYLNKDVPDEIIERLIDAARNAPFGGGGVPSQHWEFIVVRDKETKRQLAGEDQYLDFLAKAPVVIACCVNIPKKFDYRDWTLTVSLAVKNLVLAANLYGLDALFINAHVNYQIQDTKYQKMKKILGLPENMQLITLIPTGYIETGKTSIPRITKELQETIHMEKFGKK